MATETQTFLHEALWRTDKSRLWIKRAILVLGGIAALAIAAKIRIPMWPVNGTMQTFVVLLIGASYGMRLGVTTVLGYLLIGALGANIFTSSTAENYGIAYMMGGSGGFLLGFLVAAAVMGMLAGRGWDRSFATMALSMLIGTAIIYLFGVSWMYHLYTDQFGFNWVLQNGLYNFLAFDAIKLGLAAMLTPWLWNFANEKR